MTDIEVETALRVGLGKILRRRKEGVDKPVFLTHKSHRFKLYWLGKILHLEVRQFIDKK